MRCFSPTRGHLLHTSSLVGLDSGGTPSTATAEITIAIIPPSTPGGDHPQQQRASAKALLLSPKLLISPTLDMFHLPSKLASNLSNSFNCLAAGGGGTGGTGTFATAATSPLLSHHHHYHTHISTSDSNLKSSTCTTSHSLSPGGAASRPNIFTFVDAAGRQPRVCPPLSPYRSKSPLWATAPGSAESSPPPPLSPLTTVRVLHSLPASELRIVLHWLYAECLPAGLSEPELVALVAFAEGVSRLGRLADMAAANLALVRLQKREYRSGALST